jgi:hypothetical protein
MERRLQANLAAFVWSARQRAPAKPYLEWNASKSPSDKRL